VYLIAGLDCWVCFVAHTGDNRHRKPFDLASPAAMGVAGKPATSPAWPLGKYRNGSTDKFRFMESFWWMKNAGGRILLLFPAGIGLLFLLVSGAVLFYRSHQRQLRRCKN